MTIKADKGEILRYLGVKGKPDAATDIMVDECMAELDKIVRPRYIYGVYDTDMREGYVELSGTGLKLVGNDICKHLRGCPKCAVMAATLGIGVDNAIRTAQGDSMFRAVVLDACAAEYIEKLCDAVEDEIKGVAADESLKTNFRFSPGYGDLPLDTQRELLRVIDAVRKIGVTLTKGNLMTPTKSVTAVVGFTKDASEKKRMTCEVCSKRNDCKFRREGNICGRT